MVMLALSLFPTKNLESKGEVKSRAQKWSFTLTVNLLLLLKDHNGDISRKTQQSERFPLLRFAIGVPL